MQPHMLCFADTGAPLKFMPFHVKRKNEENRNIILTDSKPDLILLQYIENMHLCNISDFDVSIELAYYLFDQTPRC